MKIIEIATGKQVGAEIITDQSMDIYTACELAGITHLITPDDNGEAYYDAERDLEMIF